MFQSPHKTQAGHPSAGAGRRSSPRQFLRRITTFPLTMVAAFVSQAMKSQPVIAQTCDRPNFIFIMADDKCL